MSTEMHGVQTMNFVGHSGQLFVRWMDASQPELHLFNGVIDVGTGNVTVFSRTLDLPNWFENLGELTAVNQSSQTLYTLMDSQGMGPQRTRDIGVGCL